MTPDARYSGLDYLASIRIIPNRGRALNGPGVTWGGYQRPDTELGCLAPFSPGHGMGAFAVCPCTTALSGQRDSFPSLGAQASGPGLLGPGGWFFCSPCH